MSDWTRMLTQQLEQEDQTPPPQEESTEELKSHITRIYSPDLLKKLFAHALMIDIDSNNEKVDIIKDLCGPEFTELGPGTNRFGIMGPDGYCHKIALDRRGIVDNFTEFRRSPELDWVSPKAYETNGVILVAENVELMSKEDFVANREQILAICESLSQMYIFTDMGYAMKNFCNWGIRRNGELVILDTGYLIPRLGNEEAMTCPVCGKALDYNRNFTGFHCKKCSINFSFIDVYRRMTNKLEKELYEDMVGFELPDFSHFNSTFYNNSMMRGGHLYHGIGEESSREPIAGSLRYEDIKEILDAQRGLSSDTAEGDGTGAINPIL